MEHTVIADTPIGISEMILEGVDTSAGPIFNVGQMAQFFFARTGHWVRWLESTNKMVLDGQVVEPVRTDNGTRRYDLTTIEKIAHALASNGTIKVPQLRKALILIKTQAEMYGYLDEDYTKIIADAAAGKK